jgi:hypothetical protein
MSSAISKLVLSKILKAQTILGRKKQKIWPNCQAYIHRYHYELQYWQSDVICSGETPITPSYAGNLLLMFKWHDKVSTVINHLLILKHM